MQLQQVHLRWKWRLDDRPLQPSKQQYVFHKHATIHMTVWGGEVEASTEKRSECGAIHNSQVCWHLNDRTKGRWSLDFENFWWLYTCPNLSDPRRLWSMLKSIISLWFGCRTTTNHKDFSRPTPKSGFDQKCVFVVGLLSLYNFFVGRHPSNDEIIDFSIDQSRCGSDQKRAPVWLEIFFVGRHPSNDESLGSNPHPGRLLGIQPPPTTIFWDPTPTHDDFLGSNPHPRRFSGIQSPPLTMFMGLPSVAFQ